MYSSEHFEATGGHIGTPDPALFAGLRVLSIPTTHTNCFDLMNTAKLNQAGRKITRVYRGSQKSRKTIVGFKCTINTGKKKENTSKYSPKL